jgi:hypothetical protein
MSFDPTPELPPFPERSVDLDEGFKRFQPLVTPQNMRDQYLFGIPLKSNFSGAPQEMTDETITAFIVRAVSMVEHELKINISPVKYQDRYDYNLWDYQKYNYIQLNHWPVLQVESVKGKYPNAVDFIQYPSEWISLYGEFGMLQLTPTNGQISQFFLTNDATYIPLLLGSRAQWPQLWQITYTSGFATDKIPAIINDLIGTWAACQILSVVGPVIFPFTNYGIGIDGTSQSVGLPGPMWLQQRMGEMTAQYEKLMAVAKHYYNKSLLLGVL